MVTKGQLEQIRKLRPKQNHELHYTIGGVVEARVHSSAEAERVGMLNRGDHLMHEAVEQFENNMTFKARKGQARAQFGTNNRPHPGIDTDSGYGAGKEHASVAQHFETQQSKQRSGGRER